MSVLICKYSKKTIELFLYAVLVNVFMFLGVSVSLGNNFISERKGPVTGLSIPRYVSTSEKISNVRAGPGIRYPIRWSFTERVPLEIVDESTVWREVRDWDGNRGWIHKALLSSKQLGIVTSKTTVLRSSDSLNSKVIARLKKNVIVDVDKCNVVWCQLSAVKDNGDAITGWSNRRFFWGIESYKR